MEHGNVFVGDDLVVVSLYVERGHVDAFQVLSEVCLRERLHTVIVGLAPAHHALPPSVLDDAVQALRAGPMEPVEGGGRRYRGRGPSILYRLRRLVGGSYTLIGRATRRERPAVHLAP